MTQISYNINPVQRGDFLEYKPELIDRINLALQSVNTRIAREVNAQITSGLFADRPAQGIPNRIYVATDGTPTLYFDTGTAWITL